MENVAYSAPSKEGAKLISPERLAQMPLAEENLKHGFAIDDTFWTNNFDSLSQRFNAWAGN